jgi:hypothetical protein
MIPPPKIELYDVIPHKQLFLYITWEYSGQWITETAWFLLNQILVLPQGSVVT